MSRKNTISGTSFIQRAPWLKKAALIGSAVGLIGGAAGLSYYAWNQTGTSEQQPAAMTETKPQPMNDVKPSVSYTEPKRTEFPEARPEVKAKIEKPKMADHVKKKSKLIAKGKHHGKHKLAKGKHHGKHKLAKNKHHKKGHKVAKHSKKKVKRTVADQ